MAGVVNGCSSGSSSCIYIYNDLVCQIQKKVGRRHLTFPPCTVSLFPHKLSAAITTHPQLKYINGRAAGATSTPSPPPSFPVSETPNALSPPVDINYDATSPARSWSEFARNVSGEWDGFGADFTKEGKPIELPEAVVPEAYREWEVKVYDWQTQCPTLATPAAPDNNNHNNNNTIDASDRRIFFYKSIKLLPTVGCEADAATRYSITERNIDRVQDVRFAYQSTTGCYVTVWPVENKLWELEYCLINPKDPESRVRIIQIVHLVQELGPKSSGITMALKRITVFREQWYGPFRDGDQFGGCAIRDSAFASTPPTTASQVSGVWHRDQRAVASCFHHSTHGNVAELLTVDSDDDSRSCKSQRSGLDVILLPKQLWCSLKQSDYNAGTRCEVGWILDHGQLLTSTCTFSSTATLEEISIALETRDVTGEQV